MYVGWKFKSVCIVLCFASSNISTSSFRFPLLKQNSYLVLIETNVVTVTRALTTLAAAAAAAIATAASALATSPTVAVVEQVVVGAVVVVVVVVVVAVTVVVVVVVANQISLRRNKFPCCAVLANTVV